MAFKPLQQLTDNITAIRLAFHLNGRVPNEHELKVLHTCPIPGASATTLIDR